MDVLSLLLACSCLLVHASAAEFEVLFNEGLADIHPANDPLEARIGDTVTIICGVAGSLYRYETRFEFTACVTQTIFPLRIAFCTQGLVNASFRHDIRILDTPSLIGTGYSPGTTYYFVSYSELNMTYPSGAPCSNGAKMALHILIDPDDVTVTTDSEGGSTGGGLSPSDSPLLDTTQIIIVAVSVSIGLLVFCGIVLLIVLLFFLSCRGHRSAKRDLESPASNESVKKDSMPNKKEGATSDLPPASNKDSMPNKKERATREKSDLPPASNKDSMPNKKERATREKSDLPPASNKDSMLNKKERATREKNDLPPASNKSVKDSMPNKKEHATKEKSDLPPKTRNGSPKTTPGKADLVGKGSSKTGNGSADLAHVAGKSSGAPAVSYSKDCETVSVDGPATRSNQRSGSKSQQPNGVNRRLPSLQATDKNKPNLVGSGNRVGPSKSNGTRGSIDNDHDAVKKKTKESVGNKNVSRGPVASTNRAGGAANGSVASGASTRQGSVSGRVVSRPAPGPPAPGSQSLNPTARKNSSSVPHRPSQSLNSHS